MRASPTILRWVGAAGLTMSLLATVAWYAAWVPFVNVNDLRWLDSHSESEICTEIARVQQIWGWDHDMSLLVGRCEPEWVGKILADANGPDDLDSRAIHLGNSLRSLTGQGIAKNDLEAWRRWYAKHQDESQEQWFRDAFANAGIELPAVFTSSDVRTLLKWMGEKHSPSEPPAYAAFRLLRDQDATLEISVRGPDSAMTPAEVIGFKRYVIWKGARPTRWEGLMIATPAWRFTPPCALVIVALISAWLLGWSHGRATARTAKELPARVPA